MIIMGIDPGGTSGVIVFRWDGSIPPTPEGSEVLVSDQIPAAGMAMWADEAIKQHKPDLIVLERFFITPRTVQYTRQPDALYIIGGMQWLAELHGGIQVKLQSAADAKNAVNNDRIKELGWKIVGKHAKDAFRHVVLACHTPGLYGDSHE